MPPWLSPTAETQQGFRTRRTMTEQRDSLSVSSLGWHWGVPTRDGCNNEVWHDYNPQPVADPSLDLLVPVPLCGSRSPARAHHELNANNFLIRRLIYIHRIKSNFMWQTIFHCDTSVYYPCTPPPANTSHKQYHMDKIWKHNYYGHFVKRWLFPLILSICSARNCNKNLIV